MKNLMLVVVAAAGALALAPAASAKEMTSLAVCGQSACHSVPKSELKAFGNGPGGSGEALAGAAVEPYYVLRFGMGENGREFGVDDGVYFLPRARATRTKGDGRVVEPSTQLTPAQFAVLSTAARNLAPFPAPALASVRIGGRASVDPAAYLALLAPLELTTIPEAAGRSLMIDVRWRAANPWSSERYVNYLPRVNVLCRSDGCFKLPGGLADRLRREAAGLSPVPADTFPWTPLLAALAGAALAAGALGLVLARRRHSRRLAFPGRSPARPSRSGSAG